MFTLSLWSYRGCHKSLPSISLSVNSALRQGIVEALYEHGLLVFRNQAHLIPQDEIAFAQLCPRQLDDKNVSYTGGFRIQYRLFPTIPQLSSWVLTLTKFVITIASHNFASWDTRTGAVNVNNPQTLSTILYEKYVGTSTNYISHLSTMRAFCLLAIPTLTPCVIHFYTSCPLPGRGYPTTPPGRHRMMTHRATRSYGRR